MQSHIKTPQNVIEIFIVNEFIPDTPDITHCLVYNFKISKDYIFLFTYNFNLMRPNSLLRSARTLFKLYTNLYILVYQYIFPFKLPHFFYISTNFRNSWLITDFETNDWALPFSMSFLIISIVSIDTSFVGTIFPVNSVYSAACLGQGELFKTANVFVYGM